MRWLIALICVTLSSNSWDPVKEYIANISASSNLNYKIALDESTTGQYITWGCADGYDIFAETRWHKATWDDEKFLAPFPNITYTVNVSLLHDNQTDWDKTEWFVAYHFNADASVVLDHAVTGKQFQRYVRPSRLVTCMQDKQCSPATMPAQRGSSTVCDPKDHDDRVCKFDLDDPSMYCLGKYVHQDYGIEYNIGHLGCDPESGEWIHLMQYSDDPICEAINITNACMKPGYEGDNQIGVEKDFADWTIKAEVGCNMDKYATSSTEYIHNLITSHLMDGKSGNATCDLKCYDEDYKIKDGCEFEQFTCTQSDQKDEEFGKYLWFWESPNKCVPKCEYVSKYKSPTTDSLAIVAIVFGVMIIGGAIAGGAVWCYRRQKTAGSDCYAPLNK